MKRAFSWWGSGRGAGRSRLALPSLLGVEMLENRCVPTTITPTTFADGVLGSGSLRDAVLQFNADTGTQDDTIQLAAGTYSLTIQNVGGHHETAGLTGDLNLTRISHHWIIQGAGPSTIIDASQLHDRVFDIVTAGAHVVFNNVVIQGGLAEDDGSNGALAGSTDALGAGILNNGGDVTLENVVLQNNVARGGDTVALSAPGHNANGGAIYSTGGGLTIWGATISNNQAIGGGGGHNYYHGIGGYGGRASGGGLYATGGPLSISDSMIATNRATGGRGGDGTDYIYGSTGNGGSGGTGQAGGLYVNGGFLTIESSSIASNQGTGGLPGAYGNSDGEARGGGVYNDGTLTVSSSTLSGNSVNSRDYGADGGGIYNSGTLMVTGSTLSGNSAIVGRPGAQGGGIDNAGTLTVSNSILSGNTSNDHGGGVYNFGTLTVTDSTLSGNSATFGGGISNFGTLTVTGSTLSANSANISVFSDGGGIYNGGRLTVTSSTLSGNSAWSGGGIDTIGTQTVTLANVTFNANRALYINGNGGGLYVSPFGGTAAPVLHNTLIAGNFRGATGTTRDDVSGALDPSGNYNLIGDGTGMTGLSNGVNGNQVGSANTPIDPLLGPLQDNGGPTKTNALLAGSPAVNAGDPTQLGVPDQRGVIRSGGVNIGAYQASASAFVVTVSGAVTAGTPFDVTVQAVDDFGQVAFGYQGTVTFRVTDLDPAVMLPTDYTFTADDQGTHTFTGEFTLITPGMWMLTAVDLANGLSQDVMVTVDT
jgi:hypothetical protein